METPPPFPPLSFIVKVASRCNLNCSYCYVYNREDSTWKNKPAAMSDDIFHACVDRIREYCARSGQRAVNIVFHGGEPCLVGAERLSKWWTYAAERLGEGLRVRFTIQTNGTLLNEEWIEVFRRHEITVGISVDGPQEVNDQFRVDHAGRSSYDKTINGIVLARDAGIRLYLLCVVQPGQDGLRIHRFLMSLGVNRISYLLPDHSYEALPQAPQFYGETPCADYLIPIFEDWWRNAEVDTRIGLFWSISRLILGGDDDSDIFGNRALQTVFVETDGGIEGLDVLRVCENGMSATGLNVMHDGFDRLRDVPLHGPSIFSKLELPTDCRGCSEQNTCGGGYLPHRYSKQRLFDNRSIWCADILHLFGHIRGRLGVSPEGTAKRRELLVSVEK